jgi:hypothetical protein
MASLTWGQGTELAYHRKFTVATDVSVYFCDPKSPLSADCKSNRLPGSESATARFANDGFHSLPGSRCLHVREGRKAERHLGSSQSAGRCSLPLLLPGRRIAKQFCQEGTYYERHAIARDLERELARAKPDAALSVKINKAWADNRKLYGAWKVWHVLLREGEDVARCKVERLMRSLGIKGVIRGKRVVTTNPDTSLPGRHRRFAEKAPLVNRIFKADRPNKLCPYSDATASFTG